MGIVAHFGPKVDHFREPQRGVAVHSEEEFLELAQETAYWGTLVDFQQLQSPAYAHMQIPQHAGAPAEPPEIGKYPLGKSKWEECFGGP